MDTLIPAKSTVLSLARSPRRKSSFVPEPESDIVRSQARWLGVEELPEWDRFVQSHPGGLFYHTSKWKNVLEAAFPHMEGRFLALCDSGTGEITAGVPLYIVRSWLLGTRILSVPLASLSNPLASESAWKLLLPKVHQLEKEVSAKVIEFRSYRSLDGIQFEGFSVSTPSKHHFIPLRGTEENLKETFSKTAVLQMISRACKLGITIRKAEKGTDLQVFYDLFVATRKRLSLPPIPFRFFRAVHDCCQPENLSVFLAYQGSEPKAAIWITKYKDLSALEFTGEAPTARASGASQALYWHAVREALDEGRTSFSLGRTSVSNHGLMTYKRRWGATEEDLHVVSYAAAVSQPGPNHESSSYRAAKRIAGVLPGPMLKWMGRFCFRHWACLGISQIGFCIGAA